MIIGLVVANVQAKDYSHLLDKPFTPRSSYESKTTPMKDSPLFTPDPNIRVYTRDFAERFGMPEKWIDDDLQGVEVVAYRQEKFNQQRCGYGGNPVNCTNRYSCTFDLYTKNEDSNKIPWSNSIPDVIRPVDQSYIFLTGQTAEDHYMWEKNKTGELYGRSSAIEIGMMMWVGGNQKRIRRRCTEAMAAPLCGRISAIFSKAWI